MKSSKNYYYLCGIIGVLLLALGIFFNYKSHHSENSALYIEKSAATYTVCLKENDFYKDLCQTENKEYLSSLTNEVRVTFDYNRVYEKTTNSDFEYYVGTRLSINNKNNGREIYEDEKIISEEKNYTNNKEVDNIQDSVTIKYEDYNAIVDKYNRNYALNTSANLEVYLMIREGKEKKKVSSITFPLQEQTYSITKNVLNGEIDEKVDETYKNFMFISFFLFILDVIFIAVLVTRTIKNKNLSEFEQEVNRLLTDYDRVIVETKNDTININKKQITELDDFMELVDVRDTVEKPILYFKVSDDRRDFIVVDGELVYRYKMINKNREV